MDDVEINKEVILDQVRSVISKISVRGDQCKPVTVSDIKILSTLVKKVSLEDVKTTFGVLKREALITIDAVGEIV